MKIKKSEIYKFCNDIKLSEKILEKFLLKITGLKRNQLFLTDTFEKKDFSILKAYISRYTLGEPLEYIIGVAEFYNLDFFVDERCLIPRDDTELMVDLVLEELKDNYTIIDVGTGSGCLPISLVSSFKFGVSSCYAVDISDSALEVAEINIKNYNLQNKIKLLHSDLLSEILKTKNLKLETPIIITANLPYIKKNDYVNMDKSTIKFEPDIALYGGEKTGFEMYEKLIKQCILLKNNLKLKTGNLKLFIEIGFDQKLVATNFIEKLGLKFEIYKDSSNIERIVKINI